MELIIGGIILFIVAIAGTYVYDIWQEGKNARKAEREEARARRQALLKSKPTVNPKTIPKSHRSLADANEEFLRQHREAMARKADDELSIEKAMETLEQVIAEIEKRQRMSVRPRIKK